MKLKLKLADIEKQEITQTYSDIYDSNHRGHREAVEAMVAKALEILTAKLPEIPEPVRWIPITERMPTEADGLSGSPWVDENGEIAWLSEKLGLTRGSWDEPPQGAYAFLPIPAYVPAPEEISRKEFEAAWLDVIRHEPSALVVDMAFRVWQAARAKGGSAS